MAYSEYVTIPPCTSVEIDINIKEIGTKKENIDESLMRFVPENLAKTITKIKNIADAIPEYRLASPSQRIGRISSQAEFRSARPMPALTQISAKLEEQNLCAVTSRPARASSPFIFEFSQKKVAYPNTGISSNTNSDITNSPISK